MLYIINYACYIFAESRIAQSSDVRIDKDEKSNPIRSLSFENKSDSKYAIIALGRDTSKNNVNLMHSTSPDDPSSYTIAADLSGSIKMMSGNKWRINLDEVETDIEDDVFSIQIREGRNVHHTDAFYYDKKADKFKLHREKPSYTFFTTENIIYICLGVLGIIIAIVVLYALFFKKSNFQYESK
ncbi:hypothetical protein BDAP_001170 [Binucleata daphniae]